MHAPPQQQPGRGAYLPMPPSGGPGLPYPPGGGVGYAPGPPPRPTAGAYDQYAGSVGVGLPPGTGPPGVYSASYGYPVRTFALSLLGLCLRRTGLGREGDPLAGAGARHWRRGWVSPCEREGQRRVLPSDRSASSMVSVRPSPAGPSPWPCPRPGCCCACLRGTLADHLGSFTPSCSAPAGRHLSPSHPRLPPTAPPSINHLPCESRPNSMRQPQTPTPTTAERPSARPSTLTATSAPFTAVTARPRLNTRSTTSTEAAGDLIIESHRHRPSTTSNTPLPPEATPRHHPRTSLSPARVTCSDRGRSAANGPSCRPSRPGRAEPGTRTAEVGATRLEPHPPYHQPLLPDRPSLPRRRSTRLRSVDPRGSSRPQATSQPTSPTASRHLQRGPTCTHRLPQPGPQPCRPLQAHPRRPRLSRSGPNRKAARTNSSPRRRRR